MAILVLETDASAASPHLFAAPIFATTDRPIQVGAGDRPIDVKAADIDGDGIVDLLVDDRDGADEILLGVGDGSFEPAPPIGAELGSTALEGP